MCIRDSDKPAREPGAGSRKLAAAAIYSKFRNRVMFPIVNETGRVVAFTGRTLSTDEKLSLIHI